MLLHITQNNHSTIFKTFNSEIDKTSSKIGILGKSFNEYFNIIGKYKAPVQKVMDEDDLDRTEARKQAGSLWSYFKESNKQKITDVDAAIPKLSIEDASNLTKQIREQLDAVNRGSKSWEEYFKILKDNNQNYVVDLIKNTDDLTKLEGQDLVNACDNARKTVIAQNKEIENMSLSAKAGQTALKGLSIAGNMIIGWLFTKAIEVATEELYKFIHASEIARDKSAELTNNWTEENSSIDESINRYKELSAKLNDASLSASEVKSVKEDLIEVQKSLTDKYGQEALGIDLVNGKYDEQIKKLKQLSKQKAQDYVAENYSNIQEDQKYVTEKVNLSAGLGFNGTMARPDDYSDVGFDLEKYLKKYDKLKAKVVETAGQYGLNGEFKLITDGTLEEVYDQISQLFNDLSEDFGESNEDVNKFKDTLSKILQESFDTEQLEKSKSNIKKYAEAEILSHDNTRNLYEDAVNSVEKYNKALQSGKGIEAAKKKLDSVKEKVDTATSDISGASAVFDDVYDGINKTAESAYNVSKAFENNDSVKKYAEELRGLSSDDLLKIDFEDNVQSPGETAFKALIDIIGLSEDEVQTLIDKLIELGYVEGEVGKKSNNKKLSFSKILSDNDVDDYQKKLSSLESYLEKFKSGEFSSSDKTSLLTEFGIVADSAEEAAEKIQKRMDKVTNSIVADLKEVLNGDNISEATRKKIEALIQSLEDANRESQNLSSINLSGNALADVQSLSSGLDQLDKVYADILDKEDFDFSSVFSADFKKEFGAYTDEYNKFVETVTSSPDDINACQNAFNNLVSAYVYGSGVLDEVTESTKASCIAMLEQMGVSNAAAVVEQALFENEKMLEAQKYATAHGYDNLTDATYREITALIEEGTASEEVRLYLAKLALEKWNVNKEELKTKADCDRLLDLAKQAGATRNQINMLKNAIADLNTVDFTNPMGTMFSSVTGKALEKLAKANPNVKKTELYKQLVGKKKKLKKKLLI